MKRIILLLIILAPLFACSQAKKPILMVVPSDSYCIKKGYFHTQTINGIEKLIPDYRKTLQNDSNIRLVITKMSAIMAERGFPLKDLEQELKSIDNESAEIALLESNESEASIREDPIDIIKRSAKADIIMDLDIQTKRNGPENYVVFNLRAIDSYTNKQVAGATGQGETSTSAATEILLEEAVLSHMDNFNSGLMAHFNDMFENGREVKIMLRMWDSADVNFESTFEIDGEILSLAEIIEDWFSKMCVRGRFSNSDGSAQFQRYEQVRIPIFFERKGRERAMDTKRFVNNLKEYLNKAPFNIDSKLYQKGLGEAWLIIGEQ